MNNTLRNIAIVAHVDHGKTTLIDALLQQSGMINNHRKQIHCIMDSSELEKERQITITAKHTAILWHGYYINIIDTPGHSDFSGEVERIISMVDSVILLIDAMDGPMPQTRFVTKIAFDYGLNPIVVLNKVDIPGIDLNQVINQVFDLFSTLGANENQLDFPIVYTSALYGIAGLEYQNMATDMTPLLASIVKYTPPPKGDIDAPLQIQISQLDYSNYIGIIGIGRINRGIAKTNQNVMVINKSGHLHSGKINQLFRYMGLTLVEETSVKAGNIVVITGLNQLNISDTICDPIRIESLPALMIQEPTVSMLFSINDSPFCGQEGQWIAGSQIFKRLKKEELYNASLKITETKNTDVFHVAGRGILHLSVLIEKMRREGFELVISKPQVIFKIINGVVHEPFESIILDIEAIHQGLVMQEISLRKGKLRNVLLHGKNRIHLEYNLPSRGLIGLRTNFLTLTSGSGLMHSSFSHYHNSYSEEIGKRKNGVLISNGQGKAISYALYNLQNRGMLLIEPGEKIYEGQIIGINAHPHDLIVNCLTGKKLTNMRSAGNDKSLSLIPINKMSLDQAIEFINHDELIEVTSQTIRLRKRYLSANERKKMNKIKY